MVVENDVGVTDNTLLVGQLRLFFPGNCNHLPVQVFWDTLF